MNSGSENEIWLGESTHAKRVMSCLRTRIQPALSTQNRLISIVNDAYQSIFVWELQLKLLQLVNLKNLVLSWQLFCHSHCHALNITF